MLVLLLLALAGPGPQTIVQPRKAYSACIKRFETSSVAAKMDAAAYAAAIKTACPSEAAAFTSALVAYDVGMGTKRASATSNAAIDLADYMETSAERFRMMVTPVAPK